MKLSGKQLLFAIAVLLSVNVLLLVSILMDENSNNTSIERLKDRSGTLDQQVGELDYKLNTEIKNIKKELRDVELRLMSLSKPKQSNRN